MYDMPEYLKRKNDNYLNSLELKETIKNFLVEWKNKDEKDIDLWDFYWESLELLEEIVNLENK